jgi:hypothetical protein
VISAARVAGGEKRMHWSVWVLIALAVIVVLAVLIPTLMSVGDIARYFKIRRM